MSDDVTEFIRREDVADGTSAFYLRKPEGFAFEAGQAMDVELIRPPETDAEGNTRTFSISAAPYEEHLMFTTRMRDSAFKRVLRTVPPGAPVNVRGPSGSFTLHRDVSRPAIFLCGGIGVTPFFSMIKQSTHAGTGHGIFLFYANRRPEDAAFLRELELLQRANGYFNFIPTMTKPADSRVAWNGETGRVDGAMIGRYVDEVSLRRAIFYVAGPDPMAKAMRELLVRMGVEDIFIRTEEFSGY